MSRPRFPSLYQINSRVLLTELGKRLGRPATLDDLPDDELDRLAAAGFDWIWFLSVWQTGPAGIANSRRHPALRKTFLETLPDLREEDIQGSGFAITAYTVHRCLGGEEAFSKLRERLHARGMRLMLDFVPNHTALDHPWVEEHPEYYVHGSEKDIAREPRNYTQVWSRGRLLILAHGRDPFFPGWTDTLQLDYRQPAVQDAMRGELVRIAGRCDGLRCDMTMLVLPEVFERTWGGAPEPFWPQAIGLVREKAPSFCFMAEVYWGLELTMQQQGFDYTYDKGLYDILRQKQAAPVREHFRAGLDYQSKLVRFLENHDEPRAAVEFARETHEAAAVITFLSTGLRFFHQGQLEGRRKRVSPHLCRAPDEPTDELLSQFYERLLRILRLPILRTGHWRLLECRTAWEGNHSSEDFVAFAWEDATATRVLVAANYADHPSQCYIPGLVVPPVECQWRLADLLSDVVYVRSGVELGSPGMYLDLAPWQYHVFELTQVL